VDDFDYFRDLSEAPSTASGPDGELIESYRDATYHRAPKGLVETICGIMTNRLQPVTMRGHPGILVLLCHEGCALHSMARS